MRPEVTSACSLKLLVSEAEERAAAAALAEIERLVREAAAGSVRPHTVVA